MKHTLLFITLLFIGATSWAQRPQTEHYLDPYNPEFEKGELIVKFKDHVVLDLPKSGTATKTGISTIDELLQKKSVSSVKKVFKTATRLKSRPVVKYPNGEEKQVPALYNIYRIKMDAKVDVISLAAELAEAPDVEYAEPNYLVYSMGYNRQPTVGSQQSAVGSWQSTSNQQPATSSPPTTPSTFPVTCGTSTPLAHPLPGTR